MDAIICIAYVFRGEIMVYYKNTSRFDIRIGNKLFKSGEITGSERYIVHKGLVRVSSDSLPMRLDMSKVTVRVADKSPKVDTNGDTAAKSKSNTKNRVKKSAEKSSNLIEEDSNVETDTKLNDGGN